MTWSLYWWGGIWYREFIWSSLRSMLNALLKNRRWYKIQPREKTSIFSVIGKSEYRSRSSGALNSWSEEASTS
jgi:hypothetical protein